MVVVRHFVAAIAGDDIQVMMSFLPDFARTEQGTFKLVVRISNLIRTEDSLQAILVKRFVVRHKRNFSVLDVWKILMYLALSVHPYIRELGRIVGVVKMQSVHFATALVLDFDVDENATKPIP